METTAAGVLQRLVGLPLWSIGRAVSLEWFAFGVERRGVQLRDGTTKIVSEFALHVECAWRVRHNNRLVAAYADRFYPAGDNPYANLEEFDWEKADSNQLDERISRLLEARSASPLIVTSAEADESGSFSLELNEGYYLDVFPDNSVVREYWRLFRPYSDEPHFVFTRAGLERE